VTRKDQEVRWPQNAVRTASLVLGKSCLSTPPSREHRASLWAGALHATGRPNQSSWNAGL